MNMLIHLLVTSGYLRLILYLVFRYFQTKTDGLMDFCLFGVELKSWDHDDIFSEIQHCHFVPAKVKRPKREELFFQAGVFKCEPLVSFMIPVSGWAPKADLGRNSTFQLPSKRSKWLNFPTSHSFWVSCLTDFMKINQPSQKQPARWLVPVPCTCRWLGT